MTATKQLKIKLTEEERITLYDATYVIKNIIDILENNKEEDLGNRSEGGWLNISEAFWGLRACFDTINKEELIP